MTLSTLKLRFIAGIASICVLAGLTACEMPPSYKEKCEAAGGTYELETEVQWWTEYNPNTKMPEMKPHYIYTSHCWLDGKEIKV